MIKILTKYLNQITSSPLLSTLLLEDIQHFLYYGQFEVASYKKDSILHFDGEHCNELEIVLSGSIAIDRIDKSGNLLSISDFSDGDLIGGHLIFSSKPIYLMTVSAYSDTVILRIKKSLLFELLSSNKAFLGAYLEFVSNNASILGNKIIHYSKKSIREAIIYYLNQEFEKQKSSTIKLTMSKKNLAERIGVQRTSLSRELNKMQNDGLITFDSKYIKITDKRLLSF